MSRRIVEVAVSAGDPRRWAETVNGWWVYRDDEEDGWCVTHPKTGHALPTRFATRRVARRVARLVGDCWPPEVLEAESPDEITRLARNDWELLRRWLSDQEWVQFVD